MLCIVLFIVVGAGRHDAVDDGLPWFWTVFWPLTAGWVVAALVSRLYTRPNGMWLRLLTTIVLGFFVGGILRGVFTDRPYFSIFTVVGLAFLALDHVRLALRLVVLRTAEADARDMTSERAPYLSSRLQGFATTIFAEMSALAVRTGAVNLGQGFPDTDGPPEIADAAIAAIRAGHNQYPPGIGIPELRHAIADHQRHWYGIELDPDTEVLVTAGATEAIAASLLALCEPGDEVVMFEPYFDSYAAVHRDGRRGAEGRDAPPARLPLRSRSPAGRDHAPDPPAAPEFAAQPHRQGVQPGGARRHRGPVCGARSHRGDRRGLRAPGVRGRAPSARHLPRHARAHRHDLVGRQDVLVHRLEDRLGERAAGAPQPRCAPRSSSSPTSTARRSSTRSPRGCGCPTRGSSSSPPTSGPGGTS